MKQLSNISSLIPEKLKKKISLFWILQLIGWGFYGIVRYILSFVYDSTPFGLNKVLFLMFGVGISLLLYFFYRNRWGKFASFFTLALTVAAASVGGSFLWVMSCEVFITDFSLIKAEGGWKNIAYFSMNLSFVMLSWSFLYFGIKYWQKLEEQKELSQKANSLADQAKLQMLRYQLNPHFLFNSLNSIHALIGKEPGKAEIMLEELSDFLRYSLVKDDISETSLKMELEIIESYLAIEKIRFEEKLNYNVNLDPKLEEYKMPGFLIHPLVENAVKYGMKTSTKPLEIKIDAFRENENINISVSNTGKWFENNDQDNDEINSTKIGLENIRNRLNLVFPGKHKFDIFEKNGWVNAFIKIRHGIT